MQQPLGTAQTEQWSWILQTVWGWIWGGLSWIVDWQALVFRTVLYGDSFGQILGKFLLLFFPATVLIAGVWGTMVSLYTIPFRSRTLSSCAGHVLVGCSAHGVVLLVRPGALPPGVRRLDLGSAPAGRRAAVENPEEPGHVALRDARFQLASARGALDRVRPAA